uniref:Uncharacterized protein n=1 Tax=Rhizophora mucronata TaxID=61149 RepID=A0A2P2QET6_RHIMU
MGANIYINQLIRKLGITNKHLLSFHSRLFLGKLQRRFSSHTLTEQTLIIMEAMPYLSLSSMQRDGP